MRLPRNPFRSLKVESLESHDLFLKLFQPLALGALGDNPWDSVQVIRSAQGGGKTSLLRIVTPECLRKVADGTSPHLMEIAAELRRIGAIHEGNPTRLGVYIPLGSTPYATIARSRLGDQDPLHIFYALLDARIVLTAMRGVQALKGLDNETDLARISFDWPSDSPNRLYEFESAKDLVTWAKSTERDIWRAIDRGMAGSVAGLGHARPYSLEAFSHKAILVDGQTICDGVVVMVDDAHKLVPEQRSALMEHVITARLNVSFWVAERMHAMETYELLAPDTASTSREYRSVILSMWWQRASDSSTNKFYNELASKRLQESGVEIPFDQLVPSFMDDARESEAIATAIASLTTKLEAIKAADMRFSDVDLGQKPNQKALDHLIDLKAIDLFVASIQGNAQGSLEFEAIVPNPTSTELSGLRSAAEYQVCTQHNLPLYYGAATLFKIASWNVDQLLSIASSVFDQYDAQRVRNSGSKVLPRVQDKVVRQVAEDYWKGLPKRMPNGEKMQRFLQAFAKHATAESLGSTCKYPPGVTGFGVTSKDHDRLRNSSATVDAHLVELANLLSSAVAHNVVFMRADSKQGRAGETVTVFYLNRLLCVYLNLPVGLGGWWKRKADHFAGLLVPERNSGAIASTTTLFERSEKGP